MRFEALDRIDHKLQFSESRPLFLMKFLPGERSAEVAGLDAAQDCLGAVDAVIDCRAVDTKGMAFEVFTSGTG